MYCNINRHGYRDTCILVPVHRSHWSLFHFISLKCSQEQDAICSTLNRTRLAKMPSYAIYGVVSGDMNTLMDSLERWNVICKVINTFPLLAFLLDGRCPVSIPTTAEGILESHRVLPWQFLSSSLSFSWEKQ